jgi:hypothetical protein
MRVIMNKKVLTFSLFVFVLGVCGYILLSKNGPTEAMQSLPIGSSYDDLLALVGEPSYVTDGTEGPERGFKKYQEQRISGCVKEVWYENALKLPSKYAFCFSADGKLVNKYHWSSW